MAFSLQNYRKSTFLKLVLRLTFSEYFYRKQIASIMPNANEKTSAWNSVCIPHPIKASDLLNCHAIFLCWGLVLLNEFFIQLCNGRRWLAMEKKVHLPSVGHPVRLFTFYFSCKFIHILLKFEIELCHLLVLSEEERF